MYNKYITLKELQTIIKKHKKDLPTHIPQTTHSYQHSSRKNKKLLNTIKLLLQSEYEQYMCIKLWTYNFNETRKKSWEIHMQFW